MVYKTGGWYLTIPKAQEWLLKATTPDWECRSLAESQEHDEIWHALLVWVNENSVLKGKGEALFLPLAEGGIAAYIYRRYGEDDPKETAKSFKPVPETQEDKDLKKLVLQESGLDDKDLVWVTILRPSGYRSYEEIWDSWIHGY
ncbi:hypothetical protein M422DRAFT_274541 [Sphaerobolus stellatus SS14]|uniref:Unplaced genomic scaffold SPHSTscaffold_395, whole genome shotgun sequence n=1 Tax=Sphaerobolus stellatus (strain SS14) TaxID=990650 RepID=A0A0C9UGS5_SPHS4|nr:hypothetical protein M422DRAFT_274541 [Sphaerobolus stellatus SS14]